MHTPIELFVSYAETDAAYVQDLIARLEPNLRSSKSLEYATFEFHRILTGERWKSRILATLTSCDAGICCLSPSFLASSFIRKEEVPLLLGDKSKVIFPVGLRPVDFELHDWQGLDELQLLRLDGRCYSELRGARRDAFALKLFRDMELRLALQSELT